MRILIFRVGGVSTCGRNYIILLSCAFINLHSADGLHMWEYRNML